MTEVALRLQRLLSADWFPSHLLPSCGFRHSEYKFNYQIKSFLTPTAAFGLSTSRSLPRSLTLESSSGSAIAIHGTLFSCLLLRCWKRLLWVLASPSTTTFSFFRLCKSQLVVAASNVNRWLVSQTHHNWRLPWINSLHFPVQGLHDAFFNLTRLVS